MCAYHFPDKGPYLLRGQGGEPAFHAWNCCVQTCCLRQPEHGHPHWLSLIQQPGRGKRKETFLFSKHIDPNNPMHLLEQPSFKKTKWNHTVYSFAINVDLFIDAIHFFLVISRDFSTHNSPPHTHTHSTPAALIRV